MPRTYASKRDIIVDGASRLFYERGTSLGVDTLTEEIGVAKMTLYKHFPTKDDLIVACLRHLDQRYLDRLRQGAESRGTDPRERLMGVFDALRDWFSSPTFRGCAFINAAIEIADRQHPAHRAIAEHKRAIHDLLTELIEEAGVPDPGHVAKQVLQLMEGAISTALLEGDPAAADVARATAAEVLATARNRGRDPTSSDLRA